MYRRIDYKTAQRDADKVAREIGESDERFEIDPSCQLVPPWLFDYFFKLQAQIEERSMDYEEYVRRMWAELVDGESSIDHCAVFQTFRRDLIQGICRTDMQSLVYDDITASLPQLVAILNPLVRKIILWSKGDVEATGYQVGKIRLSGLIEGTRRALKALLGAGEASYIRDCTEYIVREDKNAALEGYLQAQKDAGLESIKLVVVEDSRKNLEAVMAMVARIFGDQGKVVPVWAMYSREGYKAIAKARQLASINEVQYGDVLQQELQELAGTDFIALRAFSDLSLREDLKGHLRDAELVIDFDGVLVDNIRMRNAQSQVLAAALRQAVQCHRDLSPEAVDKYLEGRVGQTVS